MIEMAKRNPALVGGIIIGVTSLIPYLAWGAFLWAFLCGSFIAHSIISNSATPVTFAKGAKAGLLAGLVGGLIYVVIATPLTADLTINYLAQANPQTATLFANLQQKPLAKYGISFGLAFITAIFLALTALLGGIFGVVLFEKRKADRKAAILVDEETQS